jgi:predicted peroxiredoxin
MTASPSSVADWIAGHPGGFSATAGPAEAPTADRAVVAGVHRPATRLARILRIEGTGAPLTAAVANFIDQARGRGCVTIRCELADDRRSEIAALETAGFERVPAAVHQSQPARGVVRLALNRGGPNSERRVTYYGQSTDFTCGPVALMLAGHRLDPAAPVDRAREVALWRQATTVHAPGGPGGCDPMGMACAAVRMGLRVRIISTTEGPFLLDRAANERTRELMRFVQAGFREEARGLNIPVEIREWTLDDLRAAVSAGGLAIILIEQTLMTGHDTPHWILAYAEEDGVVLIDDPWVDPGNWETDTDKFAVPIDFNILDRMAWCGTATRCRVVLLLSR